jgi:pyrroloquinoline-quinone synthase
MAHTNDIDSLIAKRHLLTHPFYKAWTDGTLPRTSLADYARQYYAFESNLPRFLTALHSRADDAATRDALLSNAWDEEHGDVNHPELWLRFGEAIGVDRRETLDARPHAATRALVETYREASQEAPVAAGVAAIYAYESQLPAVSDAKIRGLQQHYGIASGEGLRFFDVHRAIDVVHASAARKVLDASVDREGDAMKLWTDKALSAWWGFLDAFPTA